MTRRRSVTRALRADIAMLDGQLDGRAALVAAAYVVAARLDDADTSTGDVVAASAELRRLHEALGAKGVTDGLDELLAEFSRAEMGDTPNP